MIPYEYARTFVIETFDWFTKLFFNTINATLYEGTFFYVADYKNKKSSCSQYLRQLRKVEGGWRGMNATQASDLVENLGE